MTIKFSDITGGGIPFGNNAGRPANPGIGKLYSNGEEKRLELYTSSGWQNIVSETPGVVSVSGNYNESIGSATLEITGTNFSTGAIASVIGTNGVEVNANSTTVNSIVSVTTTFSGLSAAHEPYDVKITNTSNLFGLLPDALYINQSPIWQTSAGSLGTFNEQVSITLSALSATDPESTPVTYALANGSTLPSGVTLSSSGVISGTLPDITTDTTYSFTINASDGANIIPRSFSLSVVFPEISGGALASDSTYYYRVFKANDSLLVSRNSINIDALIIAGGGGGGADLAGGGGAGGVLYSPSLSLPTGTHPVVVGLGGAGGYLSSPADSMRGSVAAVGLNGGNSTFNSLVAIGGGGASGYYGTGESGRLKSAQNGGSGGGAGTSAGGSNTAGSGTSGQGFNGGGGATDSKYGGGGGGGAGGAGGTGTTSQGGAGGIGTNSYSSWLSAITSVMSDISGWSNATSGGYIAGGGGGALYDAAGASSVTGQGGNGGAGGGGWGTTTHPNGYDAVTNTGSGGGGAGYNNGGTLNGGAGSSGLVVLRYLKTAVSI